VLLVDGEVLRIDVLPEAISTAIAEPINPLIPVISTRKAVLLSKIAATGPCLFPLPHRTLLAAARRRT
jgi:hypothetical protein